MELLDQDLTRLESAGLIRVAQLEPELEYLFRHEMIRDAIYTMMVRQNRRELHLAAGEAIEALYPDRLDDLAPALAHHFAEADHADKALKYLTLTGDIARRKFANSEAAAYYARALDVAKRHQRHDKLASLHESLGHMLEHTGRHAEAVSNYESMRAAAREIGDRPMELQAILLLLTIRATPTVVFDMAQAHTLGDEGLKLARDLGDRRLEASCLWSLCTLYSHSGQHAEAISYGEQSIAIARELDSREQLAYGLNDLASFAYINDFKLEKGKEALEEARQLWVELGDQPMLADSLNTAARYGVVMGDYDDAIAVSGKALAIAEATDNPWGKSYSRFATGEIYFQRGDFDKARSEFETCLEWADRAGFVAPRVGLISNLGLIYGLLGQPQRGLPLAQEALEVTASSLTTWRAWPLGNLIRLRVLNGDLDAAKAAIQEFRVAKLPTFLESGQAMEFAQAEYEIAAGSPAQAEQGFAAFISLLRQSSGQGYLCVAFPIMARAQIAQGKLDAARETLAEGRALAEKLGARWQLWQIYAMLAEVDAANRDAHQANAQEQTAFIAAHIADASLKQSFLNLPAVKALASK